MRTQRQRFRIFRVKLLDNLRPQQTGGAHLGDLHKMIHADSPEERQPRSECIDAHAGINPRSQVLQTVGQRIGNCIFESNAAPGSELPDLCNSQYQRCELGERNHDWQQR